MVITQSIQDLYDVSSKVGTVSLPIYKETALKIEFTNSDAKETVYEGREPILPFVNSEVIHADISSWRRLTSVDSRCKDVYEVSFNIKGSHFSFYPGDTIGIVPQNYDKDVESILSHLDLKTQADLSYNLSLNTTLKGVKIPVHIPVKSTLRHVLTYCLDIRSVIKKLFLLALSRHTKDEHERKALEYLCSKEGSNTYTTYILNQNLCILDLFKMFKTCKPPIEVLLANLPRLLPRPYSIVNSSKKTPDIIKICFSVMNISSNRKGLVTGWIENILLNTASNIDDRMKNLNLEDKSSLNVKIPIYIRKNISGFTLPENVEADLLLIGPGTGVSPFIGFLEEREYNKQMNPNMEVGDTWLFFGCRNPDLDFIYEQEINGFVNNGTLTQLKTAFSRVENSKNKYIQDALLDNGEEVANLIKDGATVYICGDVKAMAIHIKEVLIQCLVKHEGFTKEDGEKYITDLQKEKKYFVDLWS